jgi:histidine triad (HIT) family protein
VVPRRRGDGLRGFFWPRQRYASDQAARDVQERLVSAVARLRAEA